MSSSGYQSYPDPAPAGHPGHGYHHNAPASGPGGYAQSSYPNNAGPSSVGPAVVSPYSPNLSPHFSGTTLMLALLSLISLYEGTLRVIQNSSSSATWDTSYNYFPAAAVLIGGIWESLYSLITLFVALWALLFDWHSVMLTTLALITQIGGWYTVVVFALAEPAYNEHHKLGYGASEIYPVLNTDQSRSAYIFGWIFPLLAVNMACLAGMMFFTIQLMQIQLNKVDELHSPHYYGRRLSFWSILLLWLGISQIIYSALLLSKYDGDSLNRPIFFYPNVTTYASIVVVTGCMFTFSGLLGLFAACANNLRVSNLFIAMCSFTFLWVVGAHIMTNCGKLDQAAQPQVNNGNGSGTPDGAGGNTATNPTNPGTGALDANGFPAENFVSNAAGFGLAELGVYFGTLLIPMYLSYKAATIETVERGHYSYGPQQNYNNRPMVV